MWFRLGWNRREKSTPHAELVVPPRDRVVLGLQVVIFLEILITLILLGELGSGASLETSIFRPGSRSSVGLIISFSSD